MFDPSETIASRRQSIDRFHRLNCSPTVVIDRDAWIEPALEFTSRLNEKAAPGTPVSSIRDVVIKATALALRRHPLFNCSYNGRFRLVENDGIDIGTPIMSGNSTATVVINNADRLTVPQISSKISENLSRTFQKHEKASTRPWHASRNFLGAAAFSITGLGHIIRSRFPSWEKLWLERQHALLGGFLVTDVSGEGVTACHGQLTQPMISGLTMLAIKNDVLQEEGVLKVKRMLPLALEFDHKLIDAGGSSRFLAEIVKNIESPEQCSETV